MTLKIIGALVGIAYGFIMGLLKYLILWKKFAKADREVTTKELYSKMGISYAIDFLTLLIVFLLRKVMPFDYFWAIFGAAIGLSISTKLFSMRSLVGRVKEK